MKIIKTTFQNYFLHVLKDAHLDFVWPVMGLTLDDTLAGFATEDKPFTMTLTFTEFWDNPTKAIGLIPVFFSSNLGKSIFLTPVTGVEVVTL